MTSTTVHTGHCCVCTQSPVGWPLPGPAVLEATFCHRPAGSGRFSRVGPAPGRGDGREAPGGKLRPFEVVSPRFCASESAS